MREIACLFDWFLADEEMLNLKLIESKGRFLLYALLVRNELRTSEFDNDGVRWPESVEEEHIDSASVMILLTF